MSVLNAARSTASRRIFFCADLDAPCTSSTPAAFGEKSSRSARSASLAAVRAMRGIFDFFGGIARRGRRVRQLQRSASRATALTSFGNCCSQKIIGARWAGRRSANPPSAPCAPHPKLFKRCYAKTEAPNLSHCPASPPYPHIAVSNDADLCRREAFVECRSDAGREFGPGPGLGQHGHARVERDGVAGHAIGVAAGEEKRHREAFVAQ